MGGFPEQPRFALPDTVASVPAQLNLILFGPPGAGKGTQAEGLQVDFQLPYIATGDMLRRNVKEETALGKEAKAYMDAGDLVPDELIVAMAAERLREEDAEDGFILDGFPRTLAQAEALDKQLSDMGRRVTAALLIQVPDEEVVRRLSGRRMCVKNGHNYHVEFDPPKHEGVCDQDGSRLVQRDDDKPEVIENRLRVYHQQTEPLVEYYEEGGLLRRIDGTRPATEVHDHIRAVIATLRLEEDV
jgi:adenylate kinase